MAAGICHAISIDMDRKFIAHRIEALRNGAAPAGERGSRPSESKKPKEAVPDTTGPKARPKEIGGPSGPEPTRYGDWERNGICSDF